MKMKKNLLKMALLAFATFAASVASAQTYSGKITSSDYVLIKNYIMGTGTLSEEAKKCADYNGDGKITSSDYVLIKNYIMNN